MTPAPWFESAGPEQPLTQGDLLWEFPVPRWQTFAPQGPLDALTEQDLLDQSSEIFVTDLIVLTQACDLEQGKVSSVVLCPCVTLSAFRPDWEAVQSSRGQAPTEKAWKSHCEAITKGFLWDQAIINSYNGEPAQLRTEERFTLFSEVLTCPRWFLEHILRRKGTPRLRLLPPYREHLSESFARFFMRVGLPVAVEKSWAKK